MVLTAVGDAEVAGREKRALSDDEVQAVLAREAKKRREAAEAFAGAGRDELATRERDELAVLERYLPQQLDDASSSPSWPRCWHARTCTGCPRWDAR